MTKSTRDAAKAGELGGNVLDAKVAGTSTSSFARPDDLEQQRAMMFYAPDLPSDLVPAAMAQAMATAAEATAAEAGRGFNPAPGLVSALLGARPEIDMDGDTLSFLRRHTARPPEPGPRCGLKFDDAACCLDKDHPGDEHAAVDAEARCFLWRALPGAPVVIVYDKRADMILGQNLTTDWPSGERRPTGHEALLTFLSDQMSRAVLGDEYMGSAPSALDEQIKIHAFTLASATGDSPERVERAYRALRAASPAREGLGGDRLDAQALAEEKIAHPLRVMTRAATDAAGASKDLAAALHDLAEAGDVVLPAGYALDAVPAEPPRMDGATWIAKVLAMVNVEPWPNPTSVEPGQIWDAGGHCPWGWTEDGLLIVMRVDGDHVEFRANGGGGPPIGHAPAMLNHENPYRCVGFELEPGRRVMVGDVYVGYAGAVGSMWSAVGVIPSGRIRITRLGDADRGNMTIPADRLIRWSLWTNPARMEPGQVWEFKDFGMYDGRYVVTDVNEFGSAGLRRFDRPTRHFDGGGIDTDAGCKCAVAIATPLKARCIGFEMDDGRRVMVGDLVKPQAKNWPVHSIRAGRRAVIRTPVGLLEVPMQSIGDITSIEDQIGRAVLGADYDKPTEPNPFREAYQAWRKAMTGEAQHSSVFDVLAAIYLRENLQLTASAIGSLYLAAPSGKPFRRITTPEEADELFGVGTDMGQVVRNALALGGWVDVMVPTPAPYTYKPKMTLDALPCASFNGIDFPDEHAAKIRIAAEQVARAGGGSVEQVEAAYREIARAFPDADAPSDEVLRVSRQASFAGISFPYHEVEATTDGALITLRGEMVPFNVAALDKHQDGLPQELVIPTLGTVSMVLVGVTWESSASQRDQLKTELRFASPAYLMFGDVKEGPRFTEEQAAKAATIDALAGVPGAAARLAELRPHPFRDLPPSSVMRAEGPGSVTSAAERDSSADCGPSFTPGPSRAEAAMIKDGWVILP